MGRPGPNLINIQVPSPAAGADWSYMLPAALGECRLLTATAFLAAAIAAANRSVRLTLRDPQGNIKSRVESVDAHIALQQSRYMWGMSGTAYTGFSTETIHVPLQRGFLAGMDTVSTTTDGIQAADQWSAIFLWLERFTPA